MKKTIFLLLTLAVFFGSSQVFAYRVMEDNSRGVQTRNSLYFKREFANKNKLDEKAQHPVESVIIKVSVINQSDHRNWRKRVIGKLVAQARLAHWTRVDFIYFLEERLDDSSVQQDQQEISVLNSLIADLKGMKNSKRRFLSDALIEERINKIMIKPSLFAAIFFIAGNSYGGNYIDEIVKILDSCRPSNNRMSGDARMRIFDNEGVETYYSFGGRKRRLPRKNTLEKYFKSFFKKAMTRLENDGLAPISR